MKWRRFNLAVPIADRCLFCIVPQPQLSIRPHG
jgi:hypothetical protein